MTVAQMAARAKAHPGAVSPADRRNADLRVVQSTRHALRATVDAELREIDGLIAENRQLKAEMKRLKGEHERDRLRWEATRDAEIARARAEGRREGYSGHGNRILKGLT